MHDWISKLERAKALLDAGALTPDEFEAEKARLLPDGPSVAWKDDTAGPQYVNTNELEQFCGNPEDKDQKSPAYLSKIVVALMFIVVITGIGYLAFQRKNNIYPEPQFSSELIKELPSTESNIIIEKEIKDIPSQLDSKLSTALLEIDGNKIPKVFRGLWGISKENCANQDDYGPILISSKGFSHYEIEAQAVEIIKKNLYTIEIKFSSLDRGSDEYYFFQEKWLYDSENDQLVATTYEGDTQRTKYRRC